MDSFTRHSNSHAVALSEVARQCVEGRRQRYLAVGRTLSYPERRDLQGYFSARTLDAVRIAVATGPDDLSSYSNFPPEGREAVDHFLNMLGTTYFDVVVIEQRVVQSGVDWTRLLFHEMIHVVEYQILGIRGFVENMLWGWAGNEVDPSRIPLNSMVTDIEDACRTTTKPFAVEERLRKALGPGLGDDGVLGAT